MNEIFPTLDSNGFQKIAEQLYEQFKDALMRGDGKFAEDYFKMSQFYKRRAKLHDFLKTISAPMEA